MQTVGREKLEAVAAMRPSPPPRRFDPRRNGYKEFDLDAWIRNHRVPVRREGPWQQGGYRYVLEECPWNGHTDNAAYIVRFASGAIAAGCHHDSCQGYGWRELREHYEPGAYDERQETAGGGEEPDDSGEAGSKKPAQAELLIRYAEGAELFHTPDGEAHATIRVAGHRETWPLKSRRFKEWLLRQFYEEMGKAPSAQALTDARATIGARAVFDGPEIPVFTRIAGHEGAVYLDLCNDSWEAVEITASGWRIVPEPPVKFVRKDNAAALPRPASGGSAQELRPLLNVRAGEDFRLLVAWLVGALNPDGPYPALVLQGEQGSAKSTTVRVLRSLVDPASEPLRAPPRDERDLAIAASGNWTPALDNLSGIRGWLSDALCRLATGGGFATRELYSDDREVLFSAKRPVILNGIDSLAVAGDLRDRSLIIELPSIPPEKKRTERDFYRELEQVRPRVLGALLEAVSAALRNRDKTKLEELPRMADFAVWVAAAEEALPWEPGEFMAAYTGNRAEANELALNDDPVAIAVRALLDRQNEWAGTSTELLAKLGTLVEEDVKHSKAWPSASNALTNRLKRLAPSLREAGIEYEDGRLPGSGSRVKSLKRKPAKDRHNRHGRHIGEEIPAKAHKSGCDDPSGDVTVRDGARTGTVTDKSAANREVCDGVTVCDDKKQPLSESSKRERFTI
ncbi:MAG: hypothetical protein IN808_02920 [Rubrobacter sp.]|nr:hypothetical protein [Rubrobacter sp.]